VGNLARRRRKMLSRSQPIYPIASSWESSVDIVDIMTGYVLDGRGYIPSRGKRVVCTPQRPDRLWDPPSFLPNVYWGLKRQRREADHSPPSSAEVKNGWSSSSTPPCVFMSWRLIN
jgi:hypothetical protein